MRSVRCGRRISGAERASASSPGHMASAYQQIAVSHWEYLLFAYETLRVGERFNRPAKKRLERVKGIEPSYSAWKAAALPLSYTRVMAINYHAGQVASTATDRFGAVPRLLCPRDRPLTSADSLP